MSQKEKEQPPSPHNNKITRRELIDRAVTRGGISAMVLWGGALVTSMAKLTVDEIPAIPSDVKNIVALSAGIGLASASIVYDLSRKDTRVTPQAADIQEKVPVSETLSNTPLRNTDIWLAMLERKGTLTESECMEILKTYQTYKTVSLTTILL